ncbi:MAG: PmoA family protein [Gemmatimonadota bacterium]
MGALEVRTNLLGFEVIDGDRPVALYRAREELPRDESPKPCFAPVYTPDGILVTEYRPADHRWHTGLYFGWVHANHANLWGGGWYIPEKGRYEDVPDTHGAQRHESFEETKAAGGAPVVRERLTWVDFADAPLALEERAYTLGRCPGGYLWRLQTRIRPAAERLVLGASRAARYSGLELRLGPPFAPPGTGARHVSSAGLEGHEAIMGQRARWVSAAGATGGMVVMMDHPTNPRHPVTWFTRANLLGAGLLMPGDLTVERGAPLDLTYGFAVLSSPVAPGQVEALYHAFASAG